jgi:aspartate-semialdehyde dehydrogenase
MSLLKKKPAYRVAVVGATGAVGTEMIDVLEERNFPVDVLVPLASSRSVGGTVAFRGEEIPVQLLSKDSLRETDIALFSAGAEVSREYAPIAAQQGAVVIDNSAAWRMDPGVPLVVPVVNR